MRGEAASGFPTIFEYGLPTLVNRQGATQNDRQLEALLVMARHTENSTLIKRAGTRPSSSGRTNSSITSLIWAN
ncbi:triphosphoribosyl-dephospho-CoA synthase [Limosilactobacillus fermentum]|nr:triphosphoribosyl-dephospho-CoA synthase [Limosilactobacillus fermentum]